MIYLSWMDELRKSLPLMMLLANSFLSVSDICFTCANRLQYGPFTMSIFQELVSRVFSMIKDLELSSLQDSHSRHLQVNVQGV